ncbi:MAG: hypothetical protein D6732_11545 [Methanobacteriota archaeon]|nr:MAG: hypothetical protein D6732_11545 [Euryarchaeota archaeon]
MNSVLVTIEFENERELESQMKVLELEISQNISERAKVNLEKEKTVLHMRIESEDIIALRAFFNSMLRLMRSSVRIHNEIMERD